jgi:hypothetical protein
MGSCMGKNRPKEPDIQMLHKSTPSREQLIEKQLIEKQFKQLEHQTNALRARIIDLELKLNSSEDIVSYSMCRSERLRGEYFDIDNADIR